ncbi:MAG TPA: RNA polymerase sigma factor [Bacteroidia bacterium]|jgi:RNA polymerase sigma factor (sigma-70 family)|nr:RNA polymerase sigma factor [Bacteroidia bacterium]
MIEIDEAILQQCIRKDRKAQYGLYKVCYGFMVSVCLRYTRNRDDADALVNLGFLKILNNLEKRRSEVPFPLWIKRILINTIIDEFRKNKKEKEQTLITDFSEHPVQHDDELINDYIRKTDPEYILRLIRELPPVSGNVFNLFAIDGYSHKEIGVLLNMSEGTSKWHVNFARNKLKERLRENSKPLRAVAS